MGAIITKHENQEKEIKTFVMPIYYIKDAIITDVDMARARHSWKFIENSNGSEWLLKCPSSDFKFSSSLNWFYDSFYNRLFDVHPSCKSLFKDNIRSQGKALVAMITTTLSVLDNLPILSEALTKLAIRHAKIGVHVHQYGIVGEVLLWTLAHCLGDQFDKDTANSWLKIYSVMLSVIVPAAIAEELNILSEAKTK